MNRQFHLAMVFRCSFRCSEPPSVCVCVCASVYVGISVCQWTTDHQFNTNEKRQSPALETLKRWMMGRLYQSRTNCVLASSSLSFIIYLLFFSRFVCASSSASNSQWNSIHHLRWELNLTTNTKPPGHSGAHSPRSLATLSYTHDLDH